MLLIFGSSDPFCTVAMAFALLSKYLIDGVCYLLPAPGFENCVFLIQEILDLAF